MLLPPVMLYGVAAAADAAADDDLGAWLSDCVDVSRAVGLLMRGRHQKADQVTEPSAGSSPILSRVQLPWVQIAGSHPLCLPQ